MSLSYLKRAGRFITSCGQGQQRGNVWKVKHTVCGCIVAHLLNGESMRESPSHKTRLLISLPVLASLSVAVPATSAEQNSILSDLDRMRIDLETTKDKMKDDFERARGRMEAELRKLRQRIDDGLAEIKEGIPKPSDFYLKVIPSKRQQVSGSCDGNDILISASCTNDHQAQAAVGPIFHDLGGGKRSISCFSYNPAGRFVEGQLICMRRP
jgi:hypothetical protein